MVEGQINHEHKESEPNKPLGFVMVKGDLSKEIFGDDPSIVLSDAEAEKKTHNSLSELLEGYATIVCGTTIKVIKSKICPGLTQAELIELYGEDHGKWMESLTPEDLKEQMAIFDGTLGPLVMAIIEVPDAKNSNEAEEKLINIRNSFRKAWHIYLGKSEIKLQGGSTIFLSALHVGNYEDDFDMISRYGLNIE